MPLLWCWFSAPSFSRCEERMLSKEITLQQQNHWGEPNGQLFFSDDFKSLRRTWPMSGAKMLTRFAWEKQLLPTSGCLLSPLAPYPQPRQAPSAEANPAHSPDRLAAPWEASQAHGTNCGAAHTFLCASHWVHPHTAQLCCPPSQTHFPFELKACSLHAQLKWWGWMKPIYF